MVLMDIAIDVVATITQTYKGFCICNRVIVVYTNIEESITALSVVPGLRSSINNYEIDSIAIGEVNINFNVRHSIYSKHIIRIIIFVKKLVWM